MIARDFWLNPDLDWVWVYRVEKGEARGSDLGSERPAVVRYLHRNLGWTRSRISKVLHCSGVTINGDLADDDDKETAA